MSDPKDEDVRKAVLAQPDLKSVLKRTLGYEFESAADLPPIGRYEIPRNVKSERIGWPDGQATTFEWKNETVLTQPEPPALTMDQVLEIARGFRSVTDRLFLNGTLPLPPYLPDLIVPKPPEDRWLVPFFYGHCIHPKLSPILHTVVDGGPLQVLPEGAAYMHVAFDRSEEAFRYYWRRGRLRCGRRVRKHHSKGYRKHIREQKRLGLWENR